MAVSEERRSVLVFDMDGVLVDVADSYRATTRRQNVNEIEEVL